MSQTNTKAPADVAFAALRRPQGVSAAKVQELAGWARKPTRHDLANFAQRRGCALTERTNKDGVPVFRFVA